MKLPLSLLAVGLSLSALLTTPVSASDKVTYNYAQFAYIHSAGEVTSDKTGYALDFNAELTESFYITASLKDQSADVWVDAKSKVTASEHTIGLGWHAPMTRTTDFLLEAGYLKHDGSDIVGNSPYGNDEDGFFAKVGIRSRVTAEWEYQVYAGVKDFDFSTYVNEAMHEDDNDSIFGAEVRYYLSPTWSAGIEISEQTTGLTSMLSIRKHF